MGKRIDLHMKLKQIMAAVLGRDPGSDHVYFQPPENIRLKYPAIVYSRNNMPRIHADNSVYGMGTEYSVIVIDPNPESLLLKPIASIPTCRFDRHYVADNLNHDVFTIHY